MSFMPSVINEPFRLNVVMLSVVVLNVIAPLKARKISCTVHCMHTHMQSLKNGLHYFVTVVNYKRKMFMKSSPGVKVIKTFFLFVTATQDVIR